MRALRTAPVLAALLTLPIALAQEKGETTKPVQIQEASATKNELLDRVLGARDAEERVKALTAYMQDQLATNALYAGQYSALRTGGDELVELITAWTRTAPTKVTRPADFRRSCVRALRDLVYEEKPEELVDGLKAIATSSSESPAMRQEAAFALAQFGDRSLVEKILEGAKAGTEAEQPGRRAQSWDIIARVHYNVREYEPAIAAYKKLLLMHEAGQLELSGAPTLYYNCGCSMALAGHTDDAFEYVIKGIEAGRKAGRLLPRRLVETDMDIASLREDPRFAELLEKYYGEKKPAVGTKKGDGADK